MYFIFLFSNRMLFEPPSAQVWEWKEEKGGAIVGFTATEVSPRWNSTGVGAAGGSDATTWRLRGLVKGATR